MKQVIVTIKDETGERQVVFRGSDAPSADVVLSRVLDTAPDETLELIKSVDGRIAVDVDSSWVKRLEFAPLGNELTFVTDEDTEIPLVADMERFKQALKADSIGKFYHKLKAGRV